MNDTPPNPAAELDGMDPTLLMAAGIPPAAPRAQNGPWEPPAPEELAGAIPGIQITEFLGRGGMGAVYMGTQLSLDRPVAVKLLATHLAEDPEFEMRFQREAKSMARLNHPNIVQIFDYGRTQTGWHYLVMEYVDGSDLSRLVRSGRLDAEGALNAVSQICAALQYAHELGFVHRDIKPANVFITQQGILKVGDFGLAKIMDGTAADPAASEDITLTQPGAIMGTPSYAAPEQLGGAPVDHRADLYSLGVMFYEMLTREIPRGAPRPPSRRVAALDVRIDGVVFKALEADPGERYQSADDLRTDVDIIRTTPHQITDTTSAPPAASPAVLTDDLAATTRSLSTTLMILGLIALFTLAGLAFFLAQRKTGDTVTSETTITNSVTHNNYFTQLIASGVTTATDLESIEDIRPFGYGFIGISRAPLLWSDAVALAARTGSEILPLDPLNRESRTQLHSSLSAHSTPGLWVKDNGTAAILTDTVSRRPTGSDSILRAVFLWQPEGAAAPLETEKLSKQGKTKPKLDEDARFKKPEYITAEVRKKNLLKEPSFSVSPFSMWTRNSLGTQGMDTTKSFCLDPLVKHEGDFSLALSTDNGLRYECIQIVPVNKGHRYLLSGWIKTEKVISTSDEPKGGARLAIDWWDETSIIDGDSDWTFVSVVAVTKKEQLPIRCVLTRAKGKAYFDDLVLIELPLEGSVSSPPLLHPPPTPAPEPEPVSPPTVQTPHLPTDWTNKDGKSIRARFLRLAGEAVVVEMNGKEFTIPFSKLTPASVLQAKQLASP
jgi:serine/threonine protein kinase